jgi:shikimate dehydrogenase
MYPADLSKKNLGKLCKFLKSDKFFLGSSVTVPFKEEIMKYLDRIDESAKYIGSVNTLKKIKGKLVGFNTDFSGSIHTLNYINLTKNKKNILIFGCGGAGKACIVSALKYFNNSNLFLVNRNLKKVKKFLKRLDKINNNKLININNLKKIKNYQNIDLIINTTSIGFDNWFENRGYYNLRNYSPISKVIVKKTKKKQTLQFNRLNKKFLKKNNQLSKDFLKTKNKFSIFDIIYKPKQSVLLKHGKLNRHRTFNGLRMNLMQAVEAFKIVNNEKNEYKIIKGMKK